MHGAGRKHGLIRPFGAGMSRQYGGGRYSQTRLMELP